MRHDYRDLEKYYFKVLIVISLFDAIATFVAGSVETSFINHIEIANFTI